ncbi:MAG: response regulator [Gemmatimonadaceae bacterium]|nr:response regulator [Gemmatimonadaceae bacterium]
MTTEPAFPAHKALVVDDEDTIRTALMRFLRNRGFTVDGAGNGQDALNEIAKGGYSLMLCDVRMPGMTGVEVVPQAIERDPDLAIIMLTAVNDAGTARAVLSHGAIDYLMKPVELADLETAVQRALQKRADAIEKKRLETLIREEVKLRTTELEQEKESLRRMTVSIAETLINAMEAKDVYLRGHSQRVSEMAGLIADELGLDHGTCEDIRLAGRLHDVGKIGIREAVLNKPEALTREEFEHIKGHVKIGVDILAPLFHIGPALRYLQDHHEQWNGSGYPAGLREGQISLGGRVLSAADTFDALTSKRAYRDPLPPLDAVDHLRKDCGKLLDTRVFEALEAVVQRKHGQKKGS